MPIRDTLLKDRAVFGRLYKSPEEKKEEQEHWRAEARRLLNSLGIRHGVVTLITITPEMAKVFYLARAKNRHLSKSNLRRLIIDIKAGKWRVTGETIIFDNDDYLIDGQHRLLACMESNIPIQSYVVRGKIDAEAPTAIDIGKARTPGDLLTFHDYQDPNHLAATARWVYRLERDMMVFEREKMTRDQLLEFIAHNPDIHLSLPYGRYIGKLLIPSLGSALHFLFAQKDRQLADQMYTDLQAGTALVGTPTFVVRELLIKNKMHRAQLPVHIVAAMLIKTWNLLRTGKTAKIIRWYGESQNEAYPRVK